MNLRKDAAKGVAWTSIGTLGSGVLNLFVTIILARILTPKDFGIIELLVVFAGISDIIVDSGFSQAIIRDRYCSNKDLSSVFWFNFGIGFFLYTLLFFSSPHIAAFYDAPIMENLSRIVFLTIVFNSLSVVHNAKFSRELNFQPYSIACICAIIISGTIAVFLAKSGWGIWALAVNLAGFSFLRMSILWLFSSWYPHFVFSLSSIRKYFKFSVNLLIQGLLDKIVTNLESLIIGKIYTKKQLGFFSQGRKLDSYVTQASTNIVVKVSYPLLAKVQDDPQRLKEGYRTIVGVTMCAIAPIMMIMFCGAKYIMNGVFGSQWLPAAPYLRLWAICGLSLIIYSIFSNIFLVKGRSKLLLKCSIAKQVLRIAAIVALVHISIMHMMYGIVVVTLITGLIYIYFGGKLINYPLKDFFCDISGSLFGIILSGTISYLATPLLTANEGILGLCILVVIASLLYISILLLIKNKYFKILTSFITKR